MKKLFKFNKLILIIVLYLILTINNGIALAESYIQAPVIGAISSYYGYRPDPFSGSITLHSGIDIACNKGTPIYALQDGFISFSGKKGGYGNAIIIEHYYSDIPELPRLQTLYGHNAKNLVSKGDYVRRGQVIGFVGSTGRSTGPHLHFEVRYKNSTVNPIEYLTKLPVYLEYAQKTRESRGYTVNKNSVNGVGGY